MTPLKYSSIKKNAELIKISCKESGIAKKHMAEFIEKSQNYAWTSESPSWASHLHSGTFSALANFVRKLHLEIRGTRSNMQLREPQTMRQRYTDSSSVAASTALSDCFPSMKNFHVEISYEPSSEIFGKENPHSNIFVIPVHWYKSVYLRGIAGVKAGDGARFVLSAKPLTLNRLERENIKAYKCRTLRRHMRMNSLHTQWVMRYSVDNLSGVTAAHTEFSNCESLLKRRIRDTVDGILDAL